MSVQPLPNDFLITVRDESFPKSEVIELLLKLSAARLTAADLIAERVRAECDDRLLDREGNRRARLIAPGPKEQALKTASSPLTIDTDRQIATALSAFEANGFILLVDDRQVESLDEVIEMQPDSVVTFLKLTPLKGG